MTKKNGGWISQNSVGHDERGKMPVNPVFALLGENAMIRS